LAGLVQDSIKSITEAEPQHKPIDFKA